MLPFVEAAFVLYIPVPLSSGSSAAVLSAFTPVVKLALLTGIGAALGVDASGIFIISIAPYTYRRRLEEIEAADLGPQRGLYLQPSAGTGVSVTTGILASAAASSPLVLAAVGGSGGGVAADAAAVMAATVLVVQTQMASGALAESVAAQPALVQGLGYSSSAQLVAQLALDGAPTVRAPGPPLLPPPTSSSSVGSNGSIGAAVGIVALIAVAAFFYRYFYAPWQAKRLLLSAHQCSSRPLSSSALEASAPPASSDFPATIKAACSSFGAESGNGTETGAADNINNIDVHSPELAEVQAHAEALVQAQAQLRVRADEVARSQALLGAQIVAREEAQAQAALQAQRLTQAMAAQALAASAAAPSLPGQVEGGAMFPAAVSAFAGPSDAMLRASLSNADFVMDPDVNGFLDAHGLVDVLGRKTSRAPLLVGSVAEMHALDGRRFLPLTVRKLAELGFIAPRV